MLTHPASPGSVTRSFQYPSFIDAITGGGMGTNLPMASRTVWIAAEAPVVRSMALRLTAAPEPSVSDTDERLCVVMAMVSALEAPTWNVTVLPEKTETPANLVDEPMLSICLSSSLASASSALPSLVAVLAAALYAWRLTAAGYANEYYSAAVLSMTQSLHNFFYFAFDPGTTSRNLLLNAIIYLKGTKG